MSRRLRDDDGVSLALVGLAMTALLIIVALVVDLGYVRGSTRVEQSVADMAALAAGNGLTAKNPLKACTDVVAYVNANARDMPAINATNFCKQVGNDVTTTVCSGKPLAQAKPTATSGRYQVSLHYPVPDSEIDDPNMPAARVNDKTPCDRMRVLITATDPSFFGGVVGADDYSTTRTATVVSVPGDIRRIPALWLLDPEGCNALTAKGGATVKVGTNVVNGVIMVDSDGSSCTGKSWTVDVDANNSHVLALDGSTVGYIGLYGLPPGAEKCPATGIGVHACDPDDVTNPTGPLWPQPLPLTNRATRVPLDWAFNCKSSYPSFPELQSTNADILLNACPDTGVRGPWIDLLDGDLAGGTQPAGFTKLSGSACNPSGNQAFAGNYFVDCANYSIGNGTNVSFTGGNIIFTGNIKMTGGTLSINSQYNPATLSYNNTSNLTSNLSGNCLSPKTGKPCVDASSDDAAFAYFTKGSMEFTGGTFHANHTAIIMSTAGTVKFTGGTPPSWTAPAEGPFKGLALWAEGANAFSMNGGSGVTLSGAFFTPEGEMGIEGNGKWDVPQSAQFISYHLTVSGSGDVWLTPDPKTAIAAPPMVARLIR